MRTSAVSAELIEKLVPVQADEAQTGVPSAAGEGTDGDLFNRQWPVGKDYTETTYFKLVDDIYSFGVSVGSACLSQWAKDADAEACKGREGLKAYIEDHRQELFDCLAAFNGPAHEGRVLFDLVKKIEDEVCLAEAFS